MAITTRPELEDFLADGPPPVFAGVGSIAPQNAVPVIGDQPSWAARIAAEDGIVVMALVR